LLKVVGFIMEEKKRVRHITSAKEKKYSSETLPGKLI